MPKRNICMKILVLDYKFHAITNTMHSTPPLCHLFHLIFSPSLSLSLFKSFTISRDIVNNFEVVIWWSIDRRSLGGETCVLWVHIFLFSLFLSSPHLSHNERDNKKIVCTRCLQTVFLFRMDKEFIHKFNYIIFQCLVLFRKKSCKVKIEFDLIVV